MVKDAQGRNDHSDEKFLDRNGTEMSNVNVKGDEDALKVPQNDETEEKKKDDNKDDDDEDADGGIPLDRGYSWVVCFCGFVNNMCIFANNRCLSALFVDIREEFGENQTVTSLTFTAFALSFAVSTVLTSNIILRFVQQRTACFVAATISSIALCVSTQAPHIGVWILAYACRGLCCGCLLLTPMSMIGQYFKKRRALAASIASMGMVVSNIAFPPLATFLNQEFGLRGALLLIACFELQMIPVSLLLRSPSTYRERHQRRLKNLAELKQQNLSNQQIVPKKDTVSVEIQESGDDDVPRQNGDDVTMELIQNQNSHSYKHLDENALYSSSAPAATHFGTQISYSSVDDGEVVNDVTHDDIENNTGMELKQRHRLLPSRMLSHQENTTSGARKMSLAALGSLVDLSFVNKNNDKLEEGEEDADESEEEVTCKQLCRLETFFDVKLMKSWVFAMVTISIPISAVVNFLSIYIPVFANMVDISKERASLLLTIGGTVDLVTRLFTGWFADKNVVSKEKMIAFSLLVVAILTQLGRFFTTFTHFVVFVVISGIFSGFRSNLYLSLLYDLFDQQRAAKAFAMGLLVTTCVMAVNHPVFGALVDATGHYTIPLHYVGAILTISSCLLLLKPVAVKWDRQKKEGMKKKATAADA